MWIFLPLGLIMPSTFPRDKVDPKYLGPDGDFDIQIRVRSLSHLENFIRDYFVPMGLNISEIEATPGMDYNFRAYARKADLAEAIAQAVLDIDFQKFKPTAEAKAEDGSPLYAEGKAYHSVLNSIWGTVTRLGRPGGKWAPRAYKPLLPGAVTQQRDLFTEADYFDYDYPESTREIDDILDRVWDLPSRDWLALLSMDELDLVRVEYDRQVASERRSYKPARRGATTVKRNRKKARK